MGDSAKGGFIGHLKLEIPFSRPKSQPWIICIDRLYIIAGPQLGASFDEEAKEKLQQLRKQQQLDALENQWKASREDKSGGGWWSGSWWPSLYSSFSTSVVENLQLVITNVHFRYEDSNINPERPFAFGITIGKLAAQSTDEIWEPRYLYNEDTIKYKLVELEGLALYFDNDVQLLGDLDFKQIEGALKRVANRRGGTLTFKGHDHILEPISSKAKIKRNSSPVPLKTKDGPRFAIEVLLDRIPLSLSDIQYSGLMSVLDQFQLYFRSQKHRKMRPYSSVKLKPREWWKFAINSHLEPIKERNNRKSKAFILQRVTDIILYGKVYTAHLTDPSSGPEIKEVQKAIELKMSFEELRLIRDFITARITRQEKLNKAAEKLKEKESGASSQNTWGSWVTGWTSWYGYGELEERGDSEKEKASGGPSVTFNEPISKEEEEFLDELAEGLQDESLFKRDHTFVQLHFKLNCGTFKLQSTQEDNKGDTGSRPLTEIEFSTVEWISELRPKTSTWEFNVSLGAVYLRDLFNKDTLFPVLIQPQERKSTMSRGALDRFYSKGDESVGLASLLEDTPRLLRIWFEQRPSGTRTLYRISVDMQPLNVIYNPDVMTRLSNFFTHSEKTKYRLKISNLEMRLQNMALERYEELKSVTKAEFVHTLDELMSGEYRSATNRWDIQLDIAAPRIILPEEFLSKDSSMVIFDLGKIAFVNDHAIERQRKQSSGQNTVEMRESDEEDGEDSEEFLTPCSTPPDEEDFKEMVASTELADYSELAETLRERFYERYKLELSDLQVMVCQATDNWIAMQKKRTSQFHLVDRFSVSLQMERRIMFTSNPGFPAVTFSGSLPQLMVHIDEKKVQVLFQCLHQMQKTTEGTTSRQLSSGPTTSQSRECEIKSRNIPSEEFNQPEREPEMTRTPRRDHSALQKKAKELIVESCLALANFKFDEVSLSLHSRGRCVAELQIAGVEAEYTKRPYDFSVSFVLRSLLLVDAIQTFGPEYELLVASHRNVKVLALDTMETDSERPSNDENSEALIQIYYQQVDADCPSLNSENKRPLRIASLQFSSLDIIANQETVVELMNVVNHAMPQQQQPSGKSLIEEPKVSKESITKPSTEQEDEEEGEKMQVDAVFQRVNVILVRGMTLPGQVRMGRKVAAITISDLEFSSQLSEEQAIKGCLGGLQIIDLTSENLVHKCIVSVGERPRTKSENVDVQFDQDNDNLKAFSFDFAKPKLGSNISSESVQSICLDINMASAHYVHNGHFLSELSLCAGDFNQYAASMAKSIQTAASDVARGLVTKKIALAESFTPSPHQSPFHQAEDAGVYSDHVTTQQEVPKRVYVRANIETPVVVMPRKLNSPDLLVGRLGQISVRNTHLSETVDEESSKEFDIDRVYIDIREMHAYSMTLSGDEMRILEATEKDQVKVIKEIEKKRQEEENKHKAADDTRKNENETSKNETDKKPRTQEEKGQRNKAQTEFEKKETETDVPKYTFDYLAKSKLRTAGESPSKGKDGTTEQISSKEKGVSILHDTSLHLMIDRRSVRSTSNKSSQLMQSSDPSIHIEAQVSTDVLLTLSTKTYHLLLDTMSSLSSSIENVVPSSATVSRKGSISSLNISDSSLSLPRAESKQLILDRLQRTDPFGDPLEFDDHIGTLLHGEEPPVAEEISQPPEEVSTLITALFEVPKFQIQLQVELRDEEQEFANIVLEDFFLSFSNVAKPLTEITVHLGGMSVEDLLHKGNPAYKYLLCSSNTRDQSSRGPNLSSLSRLSYSCPETSLLSSNPILSSSLPSVLYQSPKKTTQRVLSPLRPMISPRKYPSQPQLQSSQEEDDGSVDEQHSLGLTPREQAWVEVKVTVVDKDSKEFRETYKSVNKFIDIAFHSLDMTVNLQTWVVVLEFFGIGGPPPQSSTSSVKSSLTSEPMEQDDTLQSQQSDVFIEEEEGFTDIKLAMQSFSLSLNKEEYPLAKARISNLSCDLGLRGSNQEINGSIGRLTLMDMSPKGALYKEKFVTYGDRAVAFSFYRFGEPDPMLSRSYDMKLDLKMSSVQYVHTHRFLSEVIAFSQHFLQLQEVLGRMRAASQGDEVYEIINRAARVALKIEADTPILVLPRSSTSNDMLVGYLGHLAVKNSFMSSASSDTVAGKLTANRRRMDQGEPPTEKRHRQSSFSFEEAAKKSDRLLDCMKIELNDMDIFTAFRTDEAEIKDLSFGHKRQGYLYVPKARQPQNVWQLEAAIRLECGEVPK